MKKNMTVTLALLWGATFSLLSGCSSNKIPEATEAPIPQSVIATVLADDNTTSRDEALKTQAKKPVTTTLPATSIRVANRAHAARLTPARRTVLPVRSLPVRRVKRGNWENYRAARLTGDFSRNRQTSAFIQMMIVRHGFNRGYLNYLFSNTRATPFLQRMAYRDAHPEKRKKKSRKGEWTRYRRIFLTEKTIQQGVQFWKQNKAALQRAEQTYGVPQEYILGIIGVETRYGGNVGKNRAIDALANMGFSNARRGKYFQKELESYLVMTRREGLNPLQPVASYAGALGLCQFMPSNIKKFGVDHDRSGTCNLWQPVDAIGSVANYFQKHGWRPGAPVVTLATTKGKKYRRFKSSYKKTYSLSTMRRNGVDPLERIDQRVRLLRMKTYGGEEVWLAGHNFYVITRYNHSSKYALAVHQLAQAIKRRIKPGRHTVASIQ